MRYTGGGKAAANLISHKYSIVIADIAPKRGVKEKENMKEIENEKHEQIMWLENDIEERDSLIEALQEIIEHFKETISEKDEEEGWIEETVGAPFLEYWKILSGNPQ